MLLLRCIVEAVVTCDCKGFITLRTTYKKNMLMVAYFGIQGKVNSLTGALFQYSGDVVIVINNNGRDFG